MNLEMMYANEDTDDLELDVLDLETEDELQEPDELDDSLLELLCEDGFLSPEEVCEAETSEDWEKLIRCAIERGFPMEWDAESLNTAVKLIAKKLDTLRIWKDLVYKEDQLRAPPIYV